MLNYRGSCHCGAVQFHFVGSEITHGLRCNCSICQRKGAIMSADTFSPEELVIESGEDQLSAYQFGSCIAKHYFCKICGIYPFHQTMRKPGHYRVNLGCVEKIDASRLPFEIFDGQAQPVVSR